MQAVSLAFCVSAGISATAILARRGPAQPPPGRGHPPATGFACSHFALSPQAVQKSLTDNGATTLSCSGSNTTLQSITLLSADCVAGIFLALLHFIICTVRTQTPRTRAPAARAHRASCRLWRATGRPSPLPSLG